MATSPFSVLAGGQIIPTNTVTPFYNLLPTPSQPLPTSTNILSGLADARTNGVADDRSWFQKLIDSVSNVQSQSGSDNSKPVRMTPYGTDQKVTDSTPTETVAEKGAKADQQIALQKQASTPKSNNDQTANVNAASQASTIMDVAKGFVGQSKPGDIPQQQAGTPTAQAEAKTGLAGLFADPRIQMALLGFGSSLANNMAGGQAVAQGASQFFDAQARQTAAASAAEDKQYQRSQDELKNKREDRKVLNDEEKTKIDQQKADSLAKLQQAQADAEASGIEVDKARIRSLNAATSKIYKEMKDGKTGKEAVSAKDYAKMLTDLSYNLDDPIEARRQLNDALPEDARQYATFTEEARQQFLEELKALDLTTADGKRQAASIANRYSLIYGDVSPE